MPQVSSAIDIKPNNQPTIDTKPGMNMVIETKSGLNKNFDETVIYNETRTILKGSPMGLLLSLTYNTDLTFVAPRL